MSSALDVELIVQRVGQVNPTLHIVARAARRAQIEVLHALGVHEVVQPEFEGGLEMVRQSLLHFDIAATEIVRLTDSVRHELYQPFTTLHTDARLLGQLRRAQHLRDIEWFTLPSSAPCVGQRIEACAIQHHTGVSIIAVLRGDTLHNNPSPEFVLAAEDTIAVLGTALQRDSFVTFIAPTTEERAPAVEGDSFVIAAEEKSVLPGAGP